MERAEEVESYSVQLGRLTTQSMCLPACVPYSSTIATLCGAIKLHKLRNSFVKVRLRLSVRIQQMLHLNRIFLIKQRNIYSVNAFIALRRFVVRRLSVVSLAGCASSHSVCYYCYRLMLGAVTVSAICRRPCIQGEHRRLGFTQRFTRRSIEVLYV